MVIILLLLASAASCEVSREYTSRVFKSTSKEKQDTSLIKFIQMDSVGNLTTSVNTRLPGEVVIDTLKTKKTNVEETMPTKTPVPGTVRTKKVRQ